ncbi:MAG: NAD(P)H-hydrate dehydratase, partial [Gammaproteobacteria bacterium]
MTKQISITKLDFETLIKHLPKRPLDAHKGMFGHVLVIGGDYGYAGAPRMAGEAALRVGAGLVSVITHPEHINIISSCRPELMAHGTADPNTLKTLLTRTTAIAIGPGLGQTDWSKQLLQTIIDVNLPIVLDADALNLLPSI